MISRTRQPGAQSAHLTPCRACVVPLHPRLGYSLPQSAPKDIAKRKANASELPLAILNIRITDITEAVGRQLIVLHQEPRPTGTACTAPALLLIIIVETSWDDDAGRHLAK